MTYTSNVSINVHKSGRWTWTAIVCEGTRKCDPIVGWSYEHCMRRARRKADKLEQAALRRHQSMQEFQRLVAEMPHGKMPDGPAQAPR